MQQPSLTPHIQHAGNEGEKSFKIGPDRALSVHGFNAMSNSLRVSRLLLSWMYHLLSESPPVTFQTRRKNHARRMGNDSRQDQAIEDDRFECH